MELEVEEEMCELSDLCGELITWVEMQETESNGFNFLLPIIEMVHP